MSWPEGAWRRVSVTVEGSGAREVSDVWWLMSAGRFADFRLLLDGVTTSLPYSETQAFTGTYAYDPVTVTMRWHHEVDTLDRDADIAGTIEPDPVNDRLMYEDGGDFSEVWARMDTDGSPNSAFSDGSAFIVRAGRYVIVLDSSERSAARYHFDGQRCIPLDSIDGLPLDPERLAELLIGRS